MKYFICPECGILKTDEEIRQDMKAGLVGGCYCKWDNDFRIVVEYAEITDKEYDKLSKILDRDIRLAVYKWRAGKKQLTPPLDILATLIQQEIPKKYIALRCNNRIIIINSESDNPIMDIDFRDWIVYIDMDTKKSLPVVRDTIEVLEKWCWDRWITKHVFLVKRIDTITETHED